MLKLPRLWPIVWRKTYDALNNDYHDLYDRYDRRAALGAQPWMEKCRKQEEELRKLKKELTLLKDKPHD